MNRKLYSVYIEMKVLLTNNETLINTYMQGLFVFNPLFHRKTPKFTQHKVTYVEQDTICQLLAV